MTHPASIPNPHEIQSVSDVEPLAAGITLVATPLGNIGDASDRLRSALIDADIIAAEDTRRARNLATALGISPKGKFISNFDHNEDDRTEALIRAAKAGQKVIVVTDAGMPVVSDPGLAVVAAAHDADVPVTCVPGPSAVTTALALSGLNVGHFCFDGFAPRKQGARRAWLESLKTERRACCFFESPHRLATTLKDAAEILGADRRASVSRELTKRFEETRRATLGELADWAAEGVRGEISVVIEGVSSQATEVAVEDLVGSVEELVGEGMRLKDAAKQVAAEAGMSKHRDLYQAVLAAREENR
ncbi:MAG: 16S rRNA (cytidine(1402)-2'-O)-methyltransferase [Corynebacterium sp.]|uniref:16S rRNA (cytidine(1402)-2'-O)-methyltransferase n=1 Tax=Corynebacterium sp. TaxID=1720 RepID=UPI0026DBAEB9|nr:16S rRNA (cytidine(1402)-2'-O)-methyltransferase [Corynebacterium sp.]MDO5030486.1 16S rRNA (cytidine(1402)-2'-O)-methyltransferase [Corynebacterium sp.]